MPASTSPIDRSRNATPVNSDPPERPTVQQLTPPQVSNCTSTSHLGSLVSRHRRDSDGSSTLRPHSPAPGARPDAASRDEANERKLKAFSLTFPSESPPLVLDTLEFSTEYKRDFETLPRKAAQTILRALSRAKPKDLKYNSRNHLAYIAEEPGNPDLRLDLLRNDQGKIFDVEVTRVAGIKRSAPEPLDPELAKRLKRDLMTDKAPKEFFESPDVFQLPVKGKPPDQSIRLALPMIVHDLPQQQKGTYLECMQKMAEKPLIFLEKTNHPKAFIFRPEAEDVSGVRVMVNSDRNEVTVRIPSPKGRDLVGHPCGIAEAAQAATGRWHAPACCGTGHPHMADSPRSPQGERGVSRPASHQPVTRQVRAHRGRQPGTLLLERAW